MCRCRRGHTSYSRALYTVRYCHRLASPSLDTHTHGAARCRPAEQPPAASRPAATAILECSRKTELRAQSSTVHSAHSVSAHTDTDRLRQTAAAQRQPPSCAPRRCQLPAFQCASPVLRPCLLQRRFSCVWLFPPSPSPVSCQCMRVSGGVSRAWMYGGPRHSVYKPPCGPGFPALRRPQTHRRTRHRAHTAEAVALRTSACLYRWRPALDAGSQA